MSKLQFYEIYCLLSSFLVEMSKVTFYLAYYILFLTVWSTLYKCIPIVLSSQPLSSTPALCHSSLPPPISLSLSLSLVSDVICEDSILESMTQKASQGRYMICRSDYGEPTVAVASEIWKLQFFPNPENIFFFESHVSPFLDNGNILIIQRSAESSDLPVLSFSNERKFSDPSPPKTSRATTLIFLS